MTSWYNSVLFIIGVIMFFSYKTRDISNDSASIRAFTYLCKNVKISVVGNALTFYPDMTVFSRKDILRVWKEVKKDPNLASQDVYKKYLEHEHFHHDEFDWDQSHYHWNFLTTLDQALLTKILFYFVENNLITQIEQQNFLAAFMQANLLPADEFERMITRECLKKLHDVIDETYPHGKDENMRQKAEAVWEDLARLTELGTKLPTIRHYINAVKIAITEPTTLHIEYLRELGMAASHFSPRLRAAILILGAALVTVGLCLGLTIPGVTVVAIGAMVMFGVKTHDYPGVEDPKILQDVRLPSDLLSLAGACPR